MDNRTGRGQLAVLSDRGYLAFLWNVEIYVFRYHKKTDGTAPAVRKVAQRFSLRINEVEQLVEDSACLFLTGVDAKWKGYWFVDLDIAALANAVEEAPEYYKDAFNITVQDIVHHL